VILFFTERRRELVERLPALSRAMALRGGIWICWPEGRVDTQLTEDFIREAALAIGMVDDKRATFDETWSALRLVWKPRSRLDKPEGRTKASAAQA